MKYKKIRMDYKFAEEGRFYRVVLVREDMNLVELGCALVSAVGGTMLHLFTLDKKDVSYVPRSFNEYTPFEPNPELDNFGMDVLGESFTLVYDMGDNWEFKCKIYKKVYEITDEDCEHEIIILEGAGQGIWEDNHYMLSRYLDGEIPADATQDEEMELFLPWNYDNETFGDFDKPLDLEDLNECVISDYYMALDHYHEMQDDSRAFDIDDLDDDELDDFLDDELSEEDLEMLEELTELDEDEERLMKALIQGVEEQITNLSYVEEAYLILSDKYSEESAKNMIATVLAQETFAVIMEEREFDEESYKAKLLELVEEMK